MTEAEWHDTVAEVPALLEHLRSVRPMICSIKLRQFACACCRRIAGQKIQDGKYNEFHDYLPSFNIRAALVMLEANDGLGWTRGHIDRLGAELSHVRAERAEEDDQEVVGEFDDELEGSVELLAMKLATDVIEEWQRKLRSEERWVHLSEKYAYVDLLDARLHAARAVARPGNISPQYWEALPEDFAIAAETAHLTRQAVWWGTGSRHPDRDESYRRDPELTARVEASMNEQRRLEGIAQAAILRDIVGNPFRAHPSVDPRWLTTTVVDLANAIFQDRAFDRMPILGDALMDANCDSEELLKHCRDQKTHCRGCWVIDEIRSKSH